MLEEFRALGISTPWSALLSARNFALTVWDPTRSDIRQGVNALVYGALRNPSPERMRRLAEETPEVARLWEERYDPELSIACLERLPDGSLVIQGSALLKDLKTDFELPFEESPDYHTLAGFMLARLKRIPRGGEWTEDNGYKLTIVDMEGRRILKIKVERSTAQQ